MLAPSRRSLVGDFYIGLNTSLSDVSQTSPFDTQLYAATSTDGVTLTFLELITFGEYKVCTKGGDCVDPLGDIEIVEAVDN